MNRLADGVNSGCGGEHIGVLWWRAGPRGRVEGFATFGNRGHRARVLDGTGLRRASKAEGHVDLRVLDGVGGCYLLSSHSRGFVHCLVIKRGKE